MRFCQDKKCELRTAKEVLSLIMERMHLKNDDNIAELFDVSKSTVSSWRRRNSIPHEKINAYCIEEGLSLDEMYFKEKPPGAKEAFGMDFGEPVAIYNQSNMSGLLKQTESILNSGTEYADSLAADIRSFYRAVETEKRLAEHQERIEEQHSEIVDIKRRMLELETSLTKRDDHFEESSEETVE